MLNYDKLSCIFSCLLFTSNHIIFLMQFGINEHLLIFSKTTNCIHPMGSCNFVSLWKNLLMLIYLFIIALEIMWLPTQSVRVHWCGICVRFSLNNYRTQASWTWDYIFTTIDSNVTVWLANLPVPIRAQTTLLLSTCHAMVTHWKNCFT